MEQYAFNPAMDVLYQVNSNALLTAVCVQATLAIVPHIDGPKEVWAKWMRNNLNKELDHISAPSEASPHLRILGSLTKMLWQHYGGSFNIETLQFDEVHKDDELATSTEFVNMGQDMLLELQGADFWWKVLPTSVSLNALTMSPQMVQLIGLHFRYSWKDGNDRKVVVLEKRRHVEKDNVAPWKKVNTYNDAGPSKTSDPKGKEPKKTHCNIQENLLSKESKQMLEFMSTVADLMSSYKEQK
ncbi:hypothetical protein OG21DRAFT_1527486 [Imleria badia]|nr:hypothetical protein OG21DRAFT_1527486 [Imleria badia]